MKVYKRKSVFSELKEYCHVAKEYDYIEITEWYNGEGFDVYIDSQQGRRFIPFTYGEYELLKKLVKKLKEV